MQKFAECCLTVPEQAENRALIRCGVLPAKHSEKLRSCVRFGENRQCAAVCGKDAVGNRHADTGVIRCAAAGTEAVKEVTDLFLRNP